MTFARLVLAASVNDPLPEFDDSVDFVLPPRQTANTIIQHYVANIYPLFPAFPDTTLWSLLNDIYLDTPRPLRSTEAWLFWMVLAVGSMAQSQSKHDEFYQNGIRFASHALAYADRALMPGYNTQIQSLFLLTQYAMLDPTHFDSWTLIGFTCRAVIDLGFHQDGPKGPSIDKPTQEYRRNLFYCVYSLDRYVRFGLVCHTLITY
jgi:hypothetical protein